MHIIFLFRRLLQLHSYIQRFEKTIMSIFHAKINLLYYLYTQARLIESLPLITIINIILPN